MRRILVSVVLLVALVALIGGCRKEIPEPPVTEVVYQEYLPLVVTYPALQLAAAVPSQNVNPATCSQVQNYGANKVVVLRTWDLNPPICDGIASWAEIYSPSKIGNLAGGNVPDLLTFNEWDLWTMTYQDKLSTSVDEYWRAVQAYPDRRLFAPSALKADHINDWLNLYYQRYASQPGFKAPAGLDLHIYCEFDSLSANEQMALNQLDVTSQLARDRANSRVVLSEFGCNPLWFTTNGHAKSQEFMQYVVAQSRLHREVEWVGWFSWQMSCQESWWPHGPEGCTALVNSAGQPTNYMSIYLATWLPDWNRDGCVDISDIVIVAANFGKCQ